MKTYRQLFAIREFRVLFLVQCLNIGSYAVASLALGTITFAATGSPVLTALAMFGAPLMRLVGQTPLRLRLRPRATAHRPRGRRRHDAWSTDLLQAIPGLEWGWRFVAARGRRRSSRRPSAAA